jgi:MFS family permease
MSQTGSRYRWFVVAVFFFFVLLHQADKLLIGPLTVPIMEEFDISMTQMGAVSTVAIVVSAILFPLWGYLYDRYTRSKLLALASFLWGSTTWLNALAPNYGTFLVTRASTGIDDSSYPGMWSLLSDYFGPRMRGKVYGLIQFAQPFGFLMGTILATMLGGAVGWRNVFFLTGSLGIVLAVVIFFGVREPMRGQSEPEMAGIDQSTQQSFNKEVALGLLKKKSLLLLLAQGFFGVFPWQVLTFWFFAYLQTERAYTGNEAMLTMIVVIPMLSSGYLIGGAVGDFFFRRTPRGRVLTAMVGVLAGTVFLVLALGVPAEQKALFLLPLSLACITMSVAAPNVVATVQDVAEPEVRGTAQAMLSLADNIGSALAPLLAGMIADRSSLHAAILIICVSTWLLCAALFAVVALLVPRDVEQLRQTMKARAEEERHKEAVPA